MSPPVFAIATLSPPSSSGPAPAGWEVKGWGGVAVSHRVQSELGRQEPGWNCFFYWFRWRWGVGMGHWCVTTDSKLNSVNSCLVMFHSWLSKRVRTTHYFFTQRACLLLLVFISINFISAGLTQITTSMSCTFDLKIKLIWKVFKALLIFIWPLEVARMLASFFLN